MYSNETEWVTITSDQKTIDLKELDITNTTVILGSEEIEIGNYTKLWIVVDSASGVLNST